MQSVQPRDAVAFVEREVVGRVRRERAQPVAIGDDAQRDLLRHRAAGHEHRGILAQQLCDARFERVEPFADSVDVEVLTAVRRAGRAPQLRRGSRTGRARRALVPHGARRVDDEPQLRPLLVLGDHIAFHHRSEAALRREREVLERNVLRRLFDAPGDRVGLSSSCGSFARDQAQHDGLAFGDEAQRLEAARAFVVVLEQETVDVERVEQLLGDRVVAAFGIPLAAVVAAAEMDRQLDAGLARGVEARVVGARSPRRAARRDRRPSRLRSHSRHLGSSSSCSAARRSACTATPSPASAAISRSHDRGDVARADRSGSA